MPADDVDLSGEKIEIPEDGIYVEDGEIKVDVVLPDGEDRTFAFPDNEEQREERTVDGFTAPKFLHRARSKAKGRIKRKKQERRERRKREERAERDEDPDDFSEYTGQELAADVREGGKPV